MQLRVASKRSGKSETISLRTLFCDGDVELIFTGEMPDPFGKGAHAYISQILPSAKVNIGIGKATVTAERTKPIAIPLLAALVSIVLLTSIGVWSMGQNAGRYILACGAIFILSIITFTTANNHIIHSYGLSYAAWALAIGLLISNTIGTPVWLKHGARTEMYIKTGLVLLGAEILFGKILSIGVPGLMVAWIVTPVVIIFMWHFGTKILKMVSKPLVIIIAAATSVCGVSAAIAVAGATRAKKEELTLAVGMTLIFTVLMMIFMPMFIHAIGLGEILGGAWMGGTIDSTGAVVAAGAFSRSKS